MPPDGDCPVIYDAVAPEFYDVPTLPGLNPEDVPVPLDLVSTPSGWTVWSADFIGAINNMPTVVKTSTSSSQNSSIMLNLSELPGTPSVLSSEPLEVLAIDSVHRVNYTVLHFPINFPSQTSPTANVRNRTGFKTAALPVATVDGGGLSLIYNTGTIQVSCPLASNGNFGFFPGKSIPLPNNVKIRIRVYFNGHGTISPDAYVSIWNDSLLSGATILESSHGSYYVESVVSPEKASFLGNAPNDTYFFVHGVAPLSGEDFVRVRSLEVALYDSTGDDVIAAINAQTDNDNRLQAEAQQREDDAQAAAESSISSAISGADETLSGSLDMIKAVEKLGTDLTDAFTASDVYAFHFPGVKGPFAPGGEVIEILPAQDVDLSYLPDKFGVILDAIGLVFLGLCGWRTLDYIYRLVQTILGAQEEAVDG